MRLLTLNLAAVTLIGAVGWALAGGVAGQEQQDQEQPFHATFWEYLQKADYKKSWKSWPGKPADFYPGKAPHGSFLKMYVDSDLLKNPESPPTGAIIVKENYGEDKEKLLAITIMYKTRNFDPEHDNWWWAKYNPDGSVANTNGMELVGKVKGCIDCHATAQGEDYVFANDGSE